MRKFHLGDVLSITTERMFSPSGMGGIYVILGYMVGTVPYTHQIPEALRYAKPYVLEQHPYLDEVDISISDIAEGLTILIEKYGEYLDLEPAPPMQMKHPLDMSDRIKPS